MGRYLGAIAPDLMVSICSVRETTKHFLFYIPMIIDISIAPYHQHLLLSVFWILAISVDLLEVAPHSLFRLAFFLDNVMWNIFSYTYLSVFLAVKYHIRVRVALHG